VIDKSFKEIYNCRCSTFDFWHYAFLIAGGAGLICRLVFLVLYGLACVVLYVLVYVDCMFSVRFLEAVSVFCAVPRCDCCLAVTIINFAH
jgi:hypothetical protein